MHEEIVAAGFGGQGIIRLGKILAYAAMLENRQVTYLPSYGAEVRGGTANCSVIISDQSIPSPIIAVPTGMIIMNHLSYERFVPHAGKNCFVLINASLVEKQPDEYLYAPFTELAVSLGSVKSANMVALGAFVAAKNIVSLTVVKQATCEMFAGLKKELLDLNMQAIDIGADLIAKNEIGSNPHSFL